ncbi:AAC(3) family N-acetyltransferase [Thermodesulfobacteriota bacterium]
METSSPLFTFLKAIIPRALRPAARERYRRFRSALRAKKRIRLAPIDGERLVADLRAAGIGPGDIVMVHSSLSSVGNVGGGAETFIRGFQEAVSPGGTVLMPCYNSARDVIDGMKEGNITDLRTTPSATGTITEIFRKSPGVFRSSHPFSSVCAWGDKAEYITAGHADGAKVCHGSSPIGRLVELKGKVIGVGVPLAQGLGVHHYLEDTWEGFPFEVCAAPLPVKWIDNQGNIIKRTLCRYDPDVARTRIDHEEGQWIGVKLTAHLIRKGVMRRFQYGDADSWIMEADALYEELKRLAGKGVTMYLTEERLDNRNRDPEAW